MSLVDNTVMVKRGGSYLTIPANSVERYMAKGYDVVDDSGNVVRESIPNDVATLKIAYKKHLDEIKTLKERIAELEKSNVETTTEETKPVRKTVKKSK
jgi:hypothetical protein